MAKRLMDTEMFMDPWFFELSKDGKLLWVYLLMNVNHAGLIELNKPMAKFQTGITDLDAAIEKIGGRINFLENGKLFIPKFLTFQYPNFPDSKVRACQSAVKLLENEGIDPNNLNSYLTVTQQLPNCYGNGNGNGNGYGNGKEDSKKIEKPPGQIKFRDNVLLTQIEFDTLVEKHGAVDTEHLLDILNNYKLAHGKKYKSDYGAINSWVVKRLAEDRPGTSNSNYKHDPKNPHIGIAKTGIGKGFKFYSDNEKQ